jgi:Flp pilus assembly protein TadD
LLQRRRAFVLGCAGLLLSIAAPVLIQAASSKADVTRQIRFGADMARQGNWHEAIFRWQRALTLAPLNARLHNNLAVAYESLGQFDKADAEYREAAALPDAPEVIARNRELFEKFYKRYKEAVPATGAAAGDAAPVEPPPPKPQEPDAKAP